MKRAQRLGLFGLLLIVVGAFVAVVLPYLGIDLGGERAALAFSFFALGGVIFWVGVIWAWVGGMADATRVWDEMRKPLFCPVCGRRYPENVRGRCPEDGSELRLAT